jgi:hypothetical protein
MRGPWGTETRMDGGYREGQAREGRWTGSKKAIRGEGRGSAKRGMDRREMERWRRDRNDGGD